MRQTLSGGTILAAILLMMLETPQPVAAKAMYGKAALIVRDLATHRALEGVAITLQYADPAEQRRERIAVRDNTAVTGADGFAAARVYVGSTASSGTEKNVEIAGVRVVAAKSGYQPFDGVSRVFYVAMLKGKGTYVFLDEVLLAPVGSSEPSWTEPQRYRPEARIEPEWGDTNTQYVVRVRLQTPAVLAHEFDKPLLHVFVRATEGVVRAIPKEEEGYRKDLVELSDDGSAPDRAAGDEEYAGVIRHDPSPEPIVIDHLHGVMRAEDPSHWLLTDEGTHILTVERKSSVGLFSVTRRVNSVILTVLEFPTRWAVAPTADAARRAFEQRFQTEQSRAPRELRSFRESLR